MQIINKTKHILILILLISFSTSINAQEKKENKQTNKPMQNML